MKGRGSVSEVKIEVEAGSFVARPYRREDEAEVLALWHLAFGRELDEAIWRWKYAENPFGQRILLCLDDNGIALVMYSGVPYRATWNGRTVEIVQLMDIMSHPDYRKTGLFVKAADAFFDHFAGGDSVLYYGIPGRYHFDIGAKYLKYSELESGVAYLRGDTSFLARNPRVFGGRAERIDRATTKLDDVWSALQSHFPLAAIRDAAFVDWRFLQNPIRDYRVYLYRSGLSKRPQGYAAVGVEGDTARVVDILVPPDQVLITDFTGQIAADLGRKGIETVETWMPWSHFICRMLKDAGWKREPEPLGIVPTARSFDDRLTIPWASDNFFYTMADSDLM